jgi:hypothetical protein
MLNRICTLTAKTRAIPSLHRDSFLAKVSGQVTGVSPPPTLSANTRGPLALIVNVSHILTSSNLTPHFAIQIKINSQC